MNAARDPHQRLRLELAQLLTQSGIEATLQDSLLTTIPRKWEKLGDLVLLPRKSFGEKGWESVQPEQVWRAVARALKVERVGRQGEVQGPLRKSGVELLLGSDGWVTHREHGVLYSFDVTRCMFSSGNVTERARMGDLDCAGEVVVDLFAGIGYYTLQLLFRAEAARVHACELNPDALHALKFNLTQNGVANRCEVLRGDNREIAPVGIADRVLLGLLPSSEVSWAIALAALKSEGGYLHLHGVAQSSDIEAWTAETLATLNQQAHSLHSPLQVSLSHREVVKWYAPHVRHLVLDLLCLPAA